MAVWYCKQKGCLTVGYEWMNLPTSSMPENPKPPRFFADALPHTTAQAYGEVATDGQGL